MLYIHIPYCHHKCTYCGFYSEASRGPYDRYVEALCRELELRRTPAPLKTVYFGGGTPSILPLELLARIVETIRKHYHTGQLEEATLEANPEHLTAEYLQGLRELHFFNRLSIGVQSFRDEDLRRINRSHSSRQALDAIRSARESGFRNLSVDLIMGLPGQTVGDWRHNLDILGSLKPEGAVTHLSCYELTLEPGTMLERQIQTGRLTPADENTVAAEYQYLQQWSQAHGFRQYEVSNYARRGYRSRHNSRYWDRTPYIGVGAAAHSFDGQHRRWNDANLQRYIAESQRGVIPYQEETLSDNDAYNEYLMTALRTTAGIRKSKVDRNRRATLAEQIKPFIESGLVEETATAWRPTSRGLLQADGIASSLFLL